MNLVSSFCRGCYWREIGIGGVEQVELMARAVPRSMDPVSGEFQGGSFVMKQPLSFDGSQEQ